MRSCPGKLITFAGSTCLYSPGGLCTGNIQLPTVVLPNALPLAPSSAAKVVATEELGLDQVPPPAAKESAAKQEESATKADDADIHVDLWDTRVWSINLAAGGPLTSFRECFNNPAFLKRFSLEEPCPLAVLRHAMLSRWQRNIYLDLKVYMRDLLGPGWAGKLRGMPVGAAAYDVLNRVCRASFWEWTDGSALIFWRWPKPQQESAWRGYPAWVSDDLQDTADDNAEKVTPFSKKR